MRFVWKRVAQLVIVLFFVTFFSFLLLSLQPGDPALVKCGLGCSEEDYQETREEMGLNRSLIVQYGDWLSDILRGDLGVSAVNQQPVSTDLANKLPVTIELIIFSQIIALVIAVPLGVASARRPNGAMDKGSTFIGFIFVATPVFVTGIVLVNFFAVRLKILPATFSPDFFEDPIGNLKSMILPAFTIALAEVAVTSRILRTDLIATLQEDYIMMAKAKGLSSRRIMWKHAFRPSTFSLITVIGLRIGGLIGSTIIIEQLFALNGMGRYVIESISKRDYVPLQGAVVVIAVAYVLINFAVDMFYAVLDPRIRHARSIAYDRRLLEPSNNAYETAVLIDENVSVEAQELLAEDELDGFVKRKLGVGFWIASAWIGTITSLAILAPWLTEHGILQDPYKLTRKLLPPSPEHWLGTDDLGRDTLSRLIWGARVSLTVGIASISLGLLFGVTTGVVSGYLKGWVDSSLMTAMDIILAFPALLLALSIIGFSGQKTIPYISLAIGVVAIPAIARLVRANTLSFHEREFVLASRTLGASHGRILAREILPNVVPPVVSFSVIGIALAISAEAGLAFLGVSVELPTATWGGMINAARPQMQNYPLQVFIPCAVLTITIMAFYLMGDRLRAYFDVKEGGL